MPSHRAIASYLNAQNNLQCPDCLVKFDDTINLIEHLHLDHKAHASDANSFNFTTNPSIPQPDELRPIEYTKGTCSKHLEP